MRIRFIFLFLDLYRFFILCLLLSFKGKPNYVVVLEANRTVDSDSIGRFKKMKQEQLEKLSSLLTSAAEDSGAGEDDELLMNSGFAYSIPVPSLNLSICGSVRFTRKLAMQSAALETIRILYANGELNVRVLDLLSPIPSFINHDVFRVGSFATYQPTEQYQGEGKAQFFVSKYYQGLFSQVQHGPRSSCPYN